MILLKWLDDQLVGGSMSDVYQSLAHSKWDCKVPRCLRAQAAEESDLWKYPPTTGPGFPRAGETEGVPDRGGTLDAGPRTYVHRDSAEAPGGLCDWIFERQKRDCYRTVIGKGEEFLRRTLLGSRLRGVHGRVRTGASTPIHPRAGCRGW